MKLQSCEVCKKIFKTATDSKVCPRCMMGNESHFEYIKKYLQKHPGTSMQILVEETGVPIAAIEQYLRQERIEVAYGSPVTLGCNKCGTQIVTGMYCDQCARSMVRDFQKIKNEIISKEKEEKGQLKYVAAKWRSK